LEYVHSATTRRYRLRAATFPVCWPGRSHSDTSTDKTPDTPVAALREINVAPQLRLRDRGQRPFGVDEDGMAML
jgi:hypothetical protein